MVHTVRFVLVSEGTTRGPMPTRSARQPTILVIEDYGDSRQMLQLLLEGEGYRVLTAADSDEALNLVKTQPVNLILTDYGLPGMDGLTLVGCIRKLDSPSNGVPIVMMTALDGEDYSRAALEAGCSDFLPKPVDLEKLLLLLNRLLTDSRATKRAAGSSPISHQNS